MNLWPTPDNTLLDCYLRQLPPRNKMTTMTYSGTLRGFQSFVVTHFPDQPLSREVFRAWLQNRDGVWLRRTIFAATRVVDDFLDWLAINGHIEVNPLADLQATYGPKSLPGIVSALLEPNPSKALESLRRLPRFGSHLGRLMRDHLQRMRSLGYRYTAEEQTLLMFDRQLQTRPDAERQSLEFLVCEWAGLARTASSRLVRFQTGRMLTKALSRTDPSVKPMRVDNRLVREMIRERSRPYIYSREEIKLLLATASHWNVHRAPLRPLTLKTMIALAYGAGLRASEVVRLKLGDIKFDEGTIDVRDTKFFKSRRLPLTASLLASLKEYLTARGMTTAPTVGEAPFFWNERRRSGYAVNSVLTLLANVIRKAGLKPKTGRVGPRVHDLRHAFVVHRMTAWYEEGINPQSRLQYLATYLGHKDINATLVYLTVTQELLQHAGDRFRAVGARALEASQGGEPCN